MFSRVSFTLINCLIWAYTSKIYTSSESMRLKESENCSSWLYGMNSLATTIVLVKPLWYNCKNSWRPNFMQALYFFNTWHRWTWYKVVVSKISISYKNLLCSKRKRSNHSSSSAPWIKVNFSTSSNEKLFSKYES
jgi:hypothetical protein